MKNGKMRKIALERVATVKSVMADCDELFRLGAYAECAAVAASANDTCFAIVTHFARVADCVDSADNAEYGASAFWRGLAEDMGLLACAYAGVIDDCEALMGRTG